MDRLVAPVSNHRVEGVSLSAFKQLLDLLYRSCNALRWGRFAHVHLSHRLRLCEACT